MIEVLPYEHIDPAAWAALVRTSKTGTWFQSEEAYRFFASMPGLFMPFAIGIQHSEVRSQDSEVRSQRLRGVCVGYVTKDRNAIRQFFTRRAIILGGPCLADDATEEEAFTLMDAVHKRLKNKDWRLKIENAPIYIETRNFNDYSPWQQAFEEAGFAYKKHLNFHVCTDDFEVRLSDNRRRQVKKGERSEGERSEGVTEQDIREWYEVLEHLYRTKVKTPLFPITFFLEAHRQGIGTFLLVRHEGRIIGGSMVVKDAQCVYEWFECGLNADYKEQYPSVMATYSGIRYAREKGCARYDMMGAGEPGVPYGVRDFKAEFGGKLVEHGRFLCVCQKWLYKIGAFAVRVLRK